MESDESKQTEGDSTEAHTEQEDNPHLRLSSTITIETKMGQRKIHLMFGDITKLSLAERADVLLISAFPGDYTVTPGSLIGALWRAFKLSVGNLAKNKQEDLRKHFHCWWSQPLPDHIPYRQLLCFEASNFHSFRHPAEVVADVFRCLVPVFQDEEKSVITPLLSTGDQGFAHSLMLRAMVEAAVNWLRAGLPMTSLKIVIFTPYPDDLTDDQYILKKHFEEFKKVIESVQEQPVDDEINYDMYFSYNEKDENEVDRIKEQLVSQNDKISIFSEHQALQKDSVWQTSIYQVMIRCRRIVAFLSPSYLKSSDCIEQYNIAMCCNRSVRRNLLTPFYIETIVTMPTYMALCQYIDCRLRERDKEKIMASLKAYASMFGTSVRYSLLKPLAVRYDVFISYSHRNEPKAHIFFNLLQRFNPELSIFFDRIELKAGSSWQQSLYNSIDNSEVVVALISEDYIQSQVCTEEYNLALLNHISKNHDTELIPMLIEPMRSIPFSYSRVQLLSAIDDFESVATKVAVAIVNYARDNTRDDTIFNDVKVPIDVDKVLEQHRRIIFNETFDINRNIDYILKQMPQVPDSEPDSEPASGDNKETKKQDPSEAAFRIAFICSDHKYGYILNSLLKAKEPNLNTNFELPTENKKGNIIESFDMNFLENADLVVAFLSPHCVHLGKMVDDIHVALARHRKTVGRPVVYPIQVMELPKWPSYFHILPCRIALNDMIWRELRGSGAKRQWEYALHAQAHTTRAALYNHTKQRIPDEHAVALVTARDDILATLKQPRTSERNIIIPNIAKIYHDCHAKDEPTNDLPVEKVLKESLGPKADSARTVTTLVNPEDSSVEVGTVGNGNKEENRHSETSHEHGTVESGSGQNSARSCHIL